MYTKTKKNKIAIIGASCLFPEANQLEVFWDNLFEGRVSISEIDRWDTSTFYSKDISKENTSVSKWAGLITGYDQFDNAFFNISDREAFALDPQQKLLLTEAYKCIEDAGLSLNTLQEKITSVHIGAMAHDNEAVQLNVDRTFQAHSCLGNYACILANRLSHFFKLTGKSETIDTACSSSAVAIANACETLHASTADFALVGGVNAVLHPYRHVSFGKSRMLSPDGLCKTFDVEANGYVPGEGVGVLLLARLSDALELGAKVYGVIESAVVNHNAGVGFITAPDVNVQTTLLNDALKAANLKPERVTYVEAHGTGTSLGDPIEYEAIGRVYGEERKTPCYVGSVKPNIGHLEAAAGVAGVIKVLGMFKHHKLPKLATLTKKNPLLGHFDYLELLKETMDWSQSDSARVASVSSFGFGGVNAHVIISEYITSDKTEDTHIIQKVPLLLSATNKENLRVVFDKWRVHSFRSTKDFWQACHIQSGRYHLPYRVAGLGENQLEVFEDIERKLLTKQKKSIFLIEKHPELLDVQHLRALIKKCKQDGLDNDLLKKHPEFNQLIAGVLTLSLFNEYVSNGLVTTRSLFGLIVLLIESDDLSWDAFFDLYVHSKQLKIPYILAQNNGFGVNRKTLDDLTQKASLKAEEVTTIKAQHDALFKHQFTYKQYYSRYLDVFSDVDKSLLEKSVWFFAMMCASMRQVKEKWHIQVDNDVGNEAFKEIVRLISYHILEAKTILQYHQNEFNQCVIKDVGLLYKGINFSRVNQVFTKASLKYFSTSSVLKDVKIASTEPSEAFVSSTLFIKSLIPTLSRFWEGGASVKWQGLLGDLRDLNVSLPNYPFQLKSFPVSRATDGVVISKPLSKSKYASEQFISLLTHHVIENEPIYPGACFIEAARNNDLPFMYEKIQWFKAVRAGDLVFIKQVEDTIRLVDGIGNVYAEMKQAVAKIRISEAFLNASIKSMQPIDIYDLLSKAHMHYGPFIQVLNNGTISEKTAQFNLRTANNIHFTVQLDALFQAVVVFFLKKYELLEPLMPFIVEELAWFTSDSIHRITVEEKWFSTAQGKYCASIKAFDESGHLVAWVGSLVLSKQKSVEKTSFQLLGEKREVLALPTVKKAFSPKQEAFICLIVASSEQVQQSLRQELIARSIPSARNIFLTFGEAFKAHQANHITITKDLVGFNQLFGLLEAAHIEKVYVFRAESIRDYDDLFSFYLLKAYNVSHLKKMHLITAYDLMQTEAKGALDLGFIRTAEREISGFSGQVIQADTLDDIALYLLEALILFPEQDSFYLQKHKLCISKLVPVPKRSKNILYTRGVYLIAGGSGQLGISLAHYLVKKYNCKVILLGRRPVEAVEYPITFKNIDYLQADLTNLLDVERAISTIITNHGELNGIFHLGARLKDGLLMHKVEADFLSVLSPKVLGAIHLDEASKQIPLDFFVMFSSLSGSKGNPGQSDYAAANTFLEAFSDVRISRVKSGMRYGSTQSIAWPFWREGGMRLTEQAEKRINALFEVNSMDNENGFSLLEEALSNGWQENKITIGQERHQVETVSPKKYPMNTESISNKVIHIFSDFLKCPPDEIDLNLSFDNYGLDSILILDLTKKLEQVFGDISKTLFFEYNTLEALIAYFNENHKLADEPQSDTLTTQLHVTSELSRDIAIVGLSGRYPLSDSLDVFWSNLTKGIDLVTEIPTERWDYTRYAADSTKDLGGSISNWGGFLNDVAGFDAAFFGISPREAELMDPQERLYLEMAYAALEDAGHHFNQNESASAGVYVGVMYGLYQLYGSHVLPEDGVGIPNSLYAAIANRVSYLFNFNGPCMAVDTMCSSSLSAIHLAINDLLSGEIDFAVAGGVNIHSHPEKYQFLSQGGFLSSEGKCRTFGHGGDGYVPSEGVGVVVLKRLTDAVKNNDPVYGIIKASSLNHGGRTNNFTVPNPNAQAALISKAIEKSSVDVKTISYVEAHGTGTSLGDPIEIRGLTKAFNQFGNRKNDCAIGSVKSNMGHAESAAGIAGLTKVLLQMRHKQLVPSIHADTINENIAFDDSPFYVQKSVSEWKKEKQTACLSAFGAGGSNAHLVLQAFPDETSVCPVEGEYPLLLTAKTDKALLAWCRKLSQYLSLRDPNTFNVYEFAYTLGLKRTHYKVRRGVYAHNYESCLEGVEIIIKSLEFPESESNHLSINHQAVISAFIKGDDIDSELKSIFSHPARALSQIPTYCFDHKRYWYPDNLLPAKENNAHPFNMIPKWMPLPLVVDTLDALSDKRIVVLWEEAEDKALLNALNASGLRYVTHFVYADDEVQGLSKRLEASFDLILHVSKPGSVLDPKRLTRLFSIHLALAKVIKKLAAHPVQYVSFSHDTDWQAAIVFGFVQTWRQEFSKLVPKCIEYRDTNSAEQIMLELSDSSFEHRRVRYREQLREILSLEKVNAPSQDVPIIKPEGVYLLIGGFGKLGMHTLNSFAQASPATFILLGRGALDTQKQTLINAMMQKGASIDYLRCDVSDAQLFRKTCLDIMGQYQRIDGILHAGGVIQDGLILDKHLPDALRVIQSKLMSVGVISDLMNEQFIKPDWVIFYASVTGVMGNAGQVDYGAANAGLDHAAETLSQQHPDTKFLSVDWPYWKEGGMQLGAEDKLAWEKSMFSMTGLTPLDTKVALDGFYQIFNTPGVNQAVITQGDQDKIKNTLNNRLKNNVQSKSELPSIEKPSLQIETVVIASIAEVLKYNAQELSQNTSITDLGFDSVTLKELTNLINKKLKIDITPSIFFACETISEVVNYLLENHSDVLAVQPTTPLIREKNHEKNSEINDVAMIALDGIYPESDSLEDFWDKLSNGTDFVSLIPKDRWDYNAYYSKEDRLDKTNSKWGSFIKDMPLFDADFFNLSPKEAVLMDPQQRLFLQVVWTLVERAGYPMSAFSGKKIGVFVGAQFNEYQQKLAKQNIVSPYAATGTFHSIIANRVSHLFNFKGPSEVIDTACSSALVAINRAVQSIRLGESEYAIAGGVSLILSAETYLNTTQLGVLSPDGRCKVFDASANGYVKGEGIGAVLLKPLQKAILDGDNILGVIKGSGVSHGGRANSLTAPNAKSQASLIADVLVESDISPNTVGYIEAHGTGTELGDPAEIEGLKLGFTKASKVRGETLNMNYCGIGSVKSNIGHLEPAAGMASLTKVIYALQNHLLPRSLHINRVNPFIKVENTPFYLVENNKIWNQTKATNGELLPRRAGISSFGFGGMNAHLIIEGYEASRSTVYSHQNDYPICFSAKKLISLTGYIKQFLSWINDQDEQSILLQDISYTLCNGREHFEQRIVLLIKDISSLKHALKQLSVSNELVMDAKRMQQTSVDISSQLVAAAKDYFEHKSVDWSAFVDFNQSKKIMLPTYVFDKKYIWIDEEKVDEKIENLVQPIDAVEKIPEAYTYQLQVKPIQNLSGHKPKRWALLGPLHAKIDKLGDKPTLRMIFSEEEQVYSDEFMSINIQSNLSKLINKHSIERFVIDFSVLHPDEASFLFITKLIREYEGSMLECVGITDSRYEALIWSSLFKSHASAAIKFKSMDEMSLVQVQRKPVDVSSFKQGGTYLITGGAGGIGVKIAEYLLNEFRANVVLVNRSNKNRYRDSLEHLEEKYGPSVLFLSADLNDAKQARAVVTTTQQRFHALNGIFHSAGVFSVSDASQETDIIRAKINVAEALDKVSRDLRLDFFFLFSSASVLSGAPEAPAYAFANALLLKFCNERNKTCHGITRAVLWSYLEAGGMGAALEDKAAFEESLWHMQGVKPLSTEAVIDVIEHVLLSTDEVVFSSAGDKEKIEKTFSKRIEPEYIKKLDVVPNIVESTVQPSSLFIELQKIAANLIERQPEEILPKTSLSEYGYDSIAFKALAKRISEIFNVQVSPSVFYANSSLEKLVRYLEKKYSGLKTKQPTPVIKNDNTFKDQDLETRLIDMVKVLMDIPQDKVIDINAPFQTFGFESIAFKAYSKELAKAFGMSFSPSLFFSNNTIAKLKRYLTKKNPSLNVQPIEEKTPEILSTLSDDDVVIVGIACRLPGADTPEAFWDNLSKGSISITEIPESRWDWKQHYSDAPKTGHSTSRWGGFIDSVDLFDADYFDMTRKEAEFLDPQQRIFMYCVCDLLLDAGIPTHTLAGSKVGVFAGIQYQEYQNMLLDKGETHPYFLSGVAHSMLANRISYLLDINGPSEAIDTACSSSLIALNRAVNAMNLKECDAAIVGGVNLSLTEDNYIAISQLGVFSPTGRCSPFDDSANGFVKGEGASAVYLKRYADAKRDNDKIYAVIKGSAVNHGGRAHSLTAPNPELQKDLILGLYQKLKLNPDDISYIEAHGTGTELGDPVEMQGLVDTFNVLTSESSNEEQVHCHVGSVKGNIGHLESAAGIASVVKVLLMLKHEQLAPTVNFRRLNQHISLDGTGIYIADKLMPWKRNSGNKPLLAGVSSFGFGGSNAHVVLEAYPTLKAKSAEDGKAYLVMLSAKTHHALKARVKRLSKMLDNHEIISLKDLSYTSLQRVTHYDVKIYWIVDSLDALKLEVINNHTGVSPKEVGGISEWIQRFDNISVNLSSFPRYVYQPQTYWINSPADKKPIKETTSPDLITEEVLEFVSNQTGETISPDVLDKNLNLLRIDSIILVNLLAHFYQQYGIEVDTKQLTQFDTLASVIAFIEEKKSKKTIRLVTSNPKEGGLKKSFNVSGIEFHTYGKGSDPFVVLLCPNDTDYLVWEYQALFLMQQGFQVIIPHYPGVGNSESLKDISVTSAAFAIGQALLEHFGSSMRAHVIGWSLGGMVALELIKNNKQMFHSLVLLHSCLKLNAQKNILEFSRIMGLLREELSTIDEGNVLERLTSNRSNTRNEVSLSYLDSVIDYDNACIDSLNTIPVYLVLGENDKLITDTEVEWCKKKIKHLSLETIAGVGHYSPLSEPDEVNTFLLRFLKNIENRMIA
ncbi:MAG: SDR family NAD(P)-dependent oxidoreductase [Gammaproteobacteria bacterium]|nr:SDR family NAD(P)-dependent oxidoreductase [Gammaproteobacteria bacterium]